MLPVINTLKVSIVFYITQREYLKIVSTHYKLSDLDEKGAAKAASACENEIPISAYLIAAQSLAPSSIFIFIK
jgi:hypothetical protein